MIEEESDEQQIGGAEADYRAGQFVQAREFLRQAEEVLIANMRDEIKAIDENVVFWKRKRTLYCDYYNSSLNLHFEDWTFTLIRNDVVDAIVFGKHMMLMDILKVVKSCGFKERET